MSDNPLTSAKVERASTNINTWIQIGIALIVLGSIYGGFKTTSESQAANQQRTDTKLESIEGQITDFRTLSQKHEFVLTGLTAKIGEMAGAADANQKDEARQWDSIRTAEAKANGAVQKTDFLEWRIELERKNPSVTSPPLQSSP